MYEVSTHRHIYFKNEEDKYNKNIVEEATKLLEIHSIEINSHEELNDGEGVNCNLYITLYENIVSKDNCLDSIENTLSNIFNDSILTISENFDCDILNCN